VKPNDAVQAAIQALADALAAQGASSGSDTADGLLTTQDLADRLRVRKSWVYDNIKSKRIPHHKFGRHLRFNRHEIDKWVDSNRSEESR